MIIPEFSEVRRVPRSYWYTPHYLGRAQPGDLFLLGEDGEKTGGFIKIKTASVFVSVTADQAWNGAHVKWPRPEDGVDSFAVHAGGAVEFVPSKK